MRREAAPGWPAVFLPAVGCRPPAVQPRRDERVLHVCLRVPGDPQNALAYALRSLTRDGGAYAELDWCATPREQLNHRLWEAARELRPTLVFAQVQTPGVFTATDFDVLRQHAPGVVIVQWDGDHRHDHVDGEDRAWFRSLASACDASLVVCTRDVEEYARLGAPPSR